MSSVIHISRNRARKVLLRAREILSKEGSWAKGAFVVNDRGNCLGDVRSPDACAWCLTGAVQLASEHDSFLLYNDVLKFLWDNIPDRFRKCGCIVNANDSDEMDHKTILEWIDGAIEKL